MLISRVLLGNVRTRFDEVQCDDLGFEQNLTNCLTEKYMSERSVFAMYINTHTICVYVPSNVSNAVSSVVRARFATGVKTYLESSNPNRFTAESITGRFAMLKIPVDMSRLTHIPKSFVTALSTLNYKFSSLFFPTSRSSFSLFPKIIMTLKYSSMIV